MNKIVEFLKALAKRIKNYTLGISYLYCWNDKRLTFRILYRTNYILTKKKKKKKPWHSLLTPEVSI